jgi:sterol desaturase/sphingolipid hydroxylase (fatty acid hydroxylase superfamily)
LFGYWIHRAQHGLPMLWRLHAVHHSAPRVYWLNQARSHPLESLLDGLSIVPLLVLGAPERTLLVFTAFSGMHLLLQHANIDLRMGPFNWLFSLSEAHRWHHSRTRGEADANFGGVLLVWDVVFRTYAIPRDREPPADPGIADRPDFPTGYLGQLAAPFRRKLWR